jgi:hypothetical protein
VREATSPLLNQGQTQRARGSKGNAPSASSILSNKKLLSRRSSEGSIFVEQPHALQKHGLVRGASDKNVCPKPSSAMPTPGDGGAWLQLEQPHGGAVLRLRSRTLAQRQTQERLGLAVSHPDMMDAMASGMHAGSWSSLHLSAADAHMGDQELERYLQTPVSSTLRSAGSGRSWAKAARASPTPSLRSMAATPATASIFFSHTSDDHSALPRPRGTRSALAHKDPVRSAGRHPHQGSVALPARETAHGVGTLASTASDDDAVPAMRSRSDHAQHAVLAQACSPSAVKGALPQQGNMSEQDVPMHPPHESSLETVQCAGDARGDEDELSRRSGPNGHDGSSAPIRSEQGTQARLQAHDDSWAPSRVGGTAGTPYPGNGRSDVVIQSASKLAVGWPEIACACLPWYALLCVHPYVHV